MPLIQINKSTDNSNCSAQVLSLSFFYFTQIFDIFSTYLFLQDFSFLYYFDIIDPLRHLREWARE
ncbi:hypothetical protein M2138_000388 [Dysgonomonadaceae bacterium PH5-43]|nr:hypothetical protein [Dysgonomonadaceae bacterium PH5-43]